MMSKHSKPVLSNQVYDQLKFVAQILLPALGTLYFALAGLWGLPAAEEVVGTIVAVDAFLGVVLGMSTKKYRRHITVGEIEIMRKRGGGKTYSLNLHSDPEDIDARQEVLFKVNPSEAGKEET
jgi:hypothetical protein